jgi:hypothetical protein
VIAKRDRWGSHPFSDACADLDRAAGEAIVPFGRK